MAHSFSFGGTLDDPLGSAMTYLGGADYRLTVLLEKWALLAAVGVDVQQVGAGYGNASWGTRRPSKVFTLPCIVQGLDFQDTRDKADALNLLLALNRLAALKLDDIPDRYWMVRCTGTSQPQLAQMGLQFELEFTAPDPRAYALTETTQTESLSTGTNSFTVPASGAVAGTAEPDVVWTIKPSGSGSVAPIIVRNVTRDETLRWQNVLTSSEWLRITRTAYQEIIEKSTDSGATWSEVNTSIYSGARFPGLDAGASNDIEVEGIDSTGTIEIAYRARFN